MRIDLPVREAAVAAGVNLHSNMVFHCMPKVPARKRDLQYVAIMLFIPTPTAWSTHSSIVPALVRLGGFPIDWPCCVWVTVPIHVLVGGKFSYSVTQLYRAALPLVLRSWILNLENVLAGFFLNRNQAP